MGEDGKFNLQIEWSWRNDKSKRIQALLVFPYDNQHGQ